MGVAGPGDSLAHAARLVTYTVTVAAQRRLGFLMTHGGATDVPRRHSFSPHLALRERVRGLEPELSLLWLGRDYREQWREQLRARLTDLLGLRATPSDESVGPTACDLDVREIEGADCEGHSRTKVAYNVEEGMGALAWVCVPHDNSQPLPAVVCVHPRGAGKDELVGLAGEGPDGPPFAVASELAARGYVALAPDLRGFGERRGDEAGLAATGALLGRPLVGMHTWDLLRAVDYLCGRPDVRADRIGVIARGMGAAPALFAAAMDERIRCAALDGGLGTFRELIVARDCCTLGPPPETIVPGLLRHADLDDVACLIAPRALMLARGRDDRSMPVAAVEDLWARVRAGFELQGEQVKLETALVDGGEEQHAEPLMGFLDDWLRFP